MVHQFLSIEFCHFNLKDFSYKIIERAENVKVGHLFASYYLGLYYKLYSMKLTHFHEH